MREIGERFESRNNVAAQLAHCKAALSAFWSSYVTEAESTR